MNHKDKVAMARKMPRTANDNKLPRAGIFDTEARDTRGKAIAMRVKRQHDATHARAALPELRRAGAYHGPV
jgi:hypothetical protein